MIQHTCTGCGEQINPNFAFCPLCGAAVATSDAPWDELPEARRLAVISQVGARLAKGATILDAVKAEVGEAAEQLDPALAEITALIDRRWMALASSPDARPAPTERGWYVGAERPQWERFRAQLVKKGKLSAEDIDTLDSATDATLARMARPLMKSEHGARGLVVGSVQAGKTTNYSALIAKASDAGYRYFIVLTGMLENLRQQGQSRLEKELCVNTDQIRWGSFTADEDDFRAPTIGVDFFIDRPNDRYLFVVKKNVHVLKRLRGWLTEASLEGEPIIVIDDEADQASIDTRSRDDKPDLDPTKTNAEIRQLLKEMPNLSYVSYTATPFANVLMEPMRGDTKHGLDLYPKDFIISLPRSRKYFGPEELFGRIAIREDEEPTPAPNMLRVVDAVEAKDVANGDNVMSSSVVQAARWFILAAAARRARGDFGHVSMMLHASTQIAMQRIQYRKLRAWFESLVDSSGTVAPATIEALRETWEAERPKVDPASWGNPVNAFAELEPHIAGVIADTRLAIDNSNAADDERLAYDDDNPRPIVVVGGFTLSRGLTIEGLVSSVYLRTTRAFDTLLQAGRWFGYRDGYQDLQRVWITDQAREGITFVAGVEEEIRQQIARNLDLNLSPTEIGIAVRQHGSFDITASNKRRRATNWRSHGFCNYTAQMIHVPATDEDAISINLDQVRSLISNVAGGFTRHDRRAMWCASDVPWAEIRSLVHKFSFWEFDRRLLANDIVEYVEDMVAHQGEWPLTGGWQVGVVTQMKSKHGVIDLGLPGPVPLNLRSKIATEDRWANIGALVGSDDRNMEDWPGMTPDDSKRCGRLLIYPIWKGDDGNANSLGAAADQVAIALRFPADPKLMKQAAKYLVAKDVDAEPVA